MQVQMAIDVIQGQASGVKPLELRVDFGPKLRPQTALEKIVEARPDRAVGEFATGIDQSGNPGRRQRGVPQQQGEMQTDTEPGIYPGQFHRLVQAGLVYHQAGRGQNAFPMRARDGFVDGRGEAEVVRVDDETALSSTISVFCFTIGQVGGHLRHSVAA